MNTSPDPGTPRSVAVTLVWGHCVAHDAPSYMKIPGR